MKPTEKREESGRQGEEEEREGRINTGEVI